MGRGKALRIYPLILSGFNVFITLYVPTIPAIHDLGHFLNIKKLKSLAQISLYNTRVYLFALGSKKFIVRFCFRLGLIQQLNNFPQGLSFFLSDSHGPKIVTSNSWALSFFVHVSEEREKVFAPAFLIHLQSD